jgi:hypothetical protein
MAKPSSILNSDINKVLVKLVLFLVLFVLINLGLSTLLGKIYFASQGGNSGAQINYFLKQRNDVVIFGASRAMHHYIPQIISGETGMSTYNAGDDGKNSTYQLGLLDMLLKQYKPKIIIYDVGDYTTSLDGGTVDLYPYYYQYEPVEKLLNKRDKYADYKFKFHLYAYNQKIFTILRGYMKHTKPNVTGYHPGYGTIREEEIARYYQNLDSFVEPTIDPDAYQNFIQFIETCRDNHITLVLTYSPRMFGGHFKYMMPIDSLANYYQIPYFNYANQSQYVGHRDLFEDSDHLNNKGAELFSKQFGEDVHEYLLGQRTQHR